MRNGCSSSRTYEGLRETLGTSQTFNVPLAGVPRPRGQRRTRPTLAYLESYPLPNGRAIDANAASSSGRPTRDTIEDYADGAGRSSVLATSQSVFVRYTYNEGEVTNPVRVDHGREGDQDRLQFITAEHQMIGAAAFVNRAQFGYTQQPARRLRLRATTDLTLPRTTFTDIDRGIAAISISGGIAPWGGSTTNPKFHSFSNYQFSDTRHADQGLAQPPCRRPHGIPAVRPDVRLHVDGQLHVQLDQRLPATRVPRTFDAVMPGSDASRSLRQTVFGFFVQDDWQLSSRLTLNAGVRYEPTTDITETDGRLAQLIDFASADRDAERHDGGRRARQEPVAQDHRAARRVRVGRRRARARSALRGGAGVFYDLVTVNTPFVQNTAVRVPPFFNRGGLVAEPHVADRLPRTRTPRSRRCLPAQAQLEGIQYDPEQPVDVQVEPERPARAVGTHDARSGLHGHARQEPVPPDFHATAARRSEVNGRLTVLPDTPLRPARISAGCATASATPTPGTRA